MTSKECAHYSFEAMGLRQQKALEMSNAQCPWCEIERLREMNAERTS